MQHYTLFNHDEMETQIARALGTEGPFFCEVMLSPTQPQAPRALNRRNPDGTMNPTKLEDMHPFLSPEVLEEEMRI